MSLLLTEEETYGALDVETQNMATPQKRGAIGLVVALAFFLGAACVSGSTSLKAEAVAAQDSATSLDTLFASAGGGTELATCVDFENKVDLALEEQLTIMGISNDGATLAKVDRTPLEQSRTYSLYLFDAFTGLRDQSAGRLRAEILRRGRRARDHRTLRHAHGARAALIVVAPPSRPSPPRPPPPAHTMNKHHVRSKTTFSVLA